MKKSLKNLSLKWWMAISETDALEKMKKRVEYDLAYINNWSIGLDIKIVLKTSLALIRNEAY